jgi:peptide subunit release factor RF-3
LLNSAARVDVIPNVTAGPQAYVAANNAMLDKVDSLVAVWDGEAGVEGGTGHVVNEARTRQIPVTVIWPKGSRRA